MRIEYMIPLEADGAAQARDALKRFADETPNVGCSIESVLIGKKESSGHHMVLVGRSGRADAAIRKFADGNVETAPFRKPENVRYSFDRHDNLSEPELDDVPIFRP
jgi:hypothetical protein